MSKVWYFYLFFLEVIYKKAWGIKWHEEKSGMFWSNLILDMKKLEIEETKVTYYVSVLKVVY